MSSPGDRAHRLVWVELRTDHADPGVGQLTLIGMVVTDEHLAIVAHGPQIQIDADTPVAAAEEQLLAFLASHCEPRTAPLCGDTVWKDKQTLLRCMPRVMEFLHYRIVDVATLRQLAELWSPGLAQAPRAHDGAPHEAIDAAIAELDHYRRALFISSQTTG